MIYYNNQLMPNDNSAKLFMVTNSVPFERFEDHEAAIYFEIDQLVDHAVGSGENTIALIENYLEITYTDGRTIEEIVAFLIHTDKLQCALWTLKESWDKFDKTLPEDSLMHGGISKDEAIQIYSETTLRSYLEALAQFKND
ncbi:hypothetical protein [Flavivirga rizhaonensis]|uniref:Uncharacterized protein n=1 Tax=Flavivirga rizhaonensis TaxID=2559571 RepID=A0A4S1DZJ8_9FLAO|nr:hypothetical protein [Flavivirga rizhaonensis]TGV03589.1 hypothetical protein EM932_06060 [Flavivirga rizhaonensis]